MRRFVWVFVLGCGSAEPKHVTTASHEAGSGSQTPTGTSGTSEGTPDDARSDASGEPGHEPGGGGTANVGSAAPTSATSQRRVPTVAIGEPEVGATDKPIIRRYIRREAKKLQDCYDKQLVVDSTLAGTVTVVFTIASDGSVTAATGSGLSPAVDSCVADVVKQIRFPQPRGGGSIHVSYPLVFGR